MSTKKKENLDCLISEKNFEFWLRKFPDKKKRESWLWKVSKKIYTSVNVYTKKNESFDDKNLTKNLESFAAKHLPQRKFSRVWVLKLSKKKFPYKPWWPRVVVDPSRLEKFSKFFFSGHYYVFELALKVSKKSLEETAK